MSCGKDTCGDYAFLGGEIINKNSSYVVLMDDKKVIDTVNLDGNNRFIHKIESLSPGFYTFKHGDEVQMVLLEKGDSIMFRLNTFDFDESLVYTGKGAKKNNYLINDFLESEIEEKEVFKFCQLTPETFVQRLDSIRGSKNEQLLKFQKKYNPSPLFNKIAQANIDFSYFSSKEIYPFVHYGHDKKQILESLPKDFYAYRAKVNYNDDFFKDYHNYTSFLRSSFKNIGLVKHLKRSGKNGFKWMDLGYNLDRLEAIDSLVNHPEIKNELLYYFGISYLAKNKKVENNAIIVKSLLAKGTDKEKNDNIVSFNDAVMRLRAGAKFPDLDVLSLNTDAVNINEVFNQPSVVYFWSHVYKDFYESTHKKAKAFSKKYPGINFISVNIDSYSPDRWATSIRKRKCCSFKNEYMFVDPEASRRALALYPLSKVILVDGESTIVNGHTNMYDNGFEDELLALLDK